MDIIIKGRPSTDGKRSDTILSGDETKDSETLQVFSRMPSRHDGQLSGPGFHPNPRENVILHALSSQEF
jgi:hypothetical protein